MEVAVLIAGLSGVVVGFFFGVVLRPPETNQQPSEIGGNSNANLNNDYSFNDLPSFYSEVYYLDSTGLLRNGRVQAYRKTSDRNLELEIYDYDLSKTFFIPKSQILAKEVCIKYKRYNGVNLKNNFGIINNIKVENGEIVYTLLLRDAQVDSFGHILNNEIDIKEKDITDYVPLPDRVGWAFYQDFLKKHKAENEKKINFNKESHWESPI